MYGWAWRLAIGAGHWQSRVLVRVLQYVFFCNTFRARSGFRPSGVKISLLARILGAPGRIIHRFAKETAFRGRVGALARIILAFDKYAWSGRKTLFLLMCFDVRELRVEGVR